MSQSLSTRNALAWAFVEGHRPLNSDISCSMGLHLNFADGMESGSVKFCERFANELSRLW